MNAEGRPQAALNDRGGSNSQSTAQSPDEILIPQVAWAIADGRLSLSVLAPHLFEFWHVAYEAGRKSRDPEVASAQRDADRLWLHVNGEPARKAYLLTRLDEAFELADRPDAATLEDLLDGAWQIYLDGLVNLREAVAVHG
jgi:hypothetical protein